MTRIFSMLKLSKAVFLSCLAGAILFASSSSQAGRSTSGEPGGGGEPFVPFTCFNPDYGSPFGDFSQAGQSGEQDKKDPLGGKRLTNKSGYSCGTVSDANAKRAAGWKMWHKKPEDTQKALEACLKKAGCFHDADDPGTGGLGAGFFPGNGCLPDKLCKCQHAIVDERRLKCDGTEYDYDEEEEVVIATNGGMDCAKIVRAITRDGIAIVFLSSEYKGKRGRNNTFSARGHIMRITGVVECKGKNMKFTVDDPNDATNKNRTLILEGTKAAVSGKTDIDMDGWHATGFFTATPR